MIVLKIIERGIYEKSFQLKKKTMERISTMNNKVQTIYPWISSWRIDGNEKRKRKKGLSINKP